MAEYVVLIGKDLALNRLLISHMDYGLDIETKGQLMTNCSKCGQDRTTRERFCSNCGADSSVSKTGILGRWLAGGGCLFALAPIAIAILATPIGGNMFSTGGDGGGAALFFLIVTLPVGAVISIVGLVLWLSKRSK